MVSKLLGKEVVRHTLIFSMLLIVLTYYFYNNSSSQIIKRQIELIIIKAEKQLEHTELLFINNFQEAQSKNNVIIQSKVLANYASNSTPENLKLLGKNWLDLTYEQNLFSQIRFISPEGIEKVRVNHYDNNSIPVQINDLQDKSNREYFIHAKSLQPGEVGTYGFDLEKENGELVIPYTPALRVIAPLDINNKRKGYLVTNYNVPLLMKPLLFRSDKYLVPEIIADDGSYISSPKKEKLYASHIPNRQEFLLSKENKQLWHKIKNKNKNDKKIAHLITDTHLYIFNRIEVLVQDKPRFIVALNTIPFNVIHEQVDETHDKLVSNLAFSALVLLLMFFFLTFYSYRKKFFLENELSIAALKSMTSLAITDNDFKILKVNDEFLKWSKQSESKLINSPISCIKPPEQAAELYQRMENDLAKKGSWQGQITAQDALEEQFYLLVRVQVIDSEFAKYIFTFTDISERVALEEQLRERSERDALTNLWNRRMFDEQLKHQTALFKRYKESYSCCLAIMDIDHFKSVNDTYGHAKGDEVLQAVASTMTEVCRETDFIARIGGEEFAVILPYSKIENAFKVLDRLREKVKQGNELNATISGGLVEFKEKYTSEQLYKIADKALYQAKSNGRNKIELAK